MRATSSLTCIATFALALASPALGQSNEPLKIGVMLPLTGPLAPIAPEQIKGMNYAISEFGGSVAGRKIEMIVEDTGGAPATGLTKARKLVTSNNVDVMVGIVASPVALQVAPYLTSIKMPLVISNAGADTITGKSCSPYVFRTSFSSAQLSKPIGLYLAKTGVKSIYMLASDFVAPREFAAAVKAGFATGNGKVLGEAFPPFGKTQDYGPYIAQARAANAEVVVPVFFASEAILFMKQWASYGIKNLPIVAPMGLTPPMLRRAQGDAVLNVISSVNYLAELDTPENRKFVEGFRKANNGDDPEEFAVMGYDAMRFALEAVKVRNGDTANREAFAAAIAKVSYNGPRGPMSMNPANNSATQNVYIVRNVKKADKIGYELLETFPNYTDQVDGCKLN